MTPDDDEPSRHAACRRWLDGWFAPPGRALLSWLALAAVMGVAFDLGAARLITDWVGFFFDDLDRIAPRPVHPAVRVLAIAANFALLTFWFEPLVLRLSLLRGVVWLGLRIVLNLVAYLFNQTDFALHNALAIFVWALLTVPVLRGVRHHPWRAALGGMLMATIAGACLHWRMDGASWWMQPATILPYAVVVLFGTRRLPR